MATTDDNLCKPSAPGETSTIASSPHDAPMPAADDASAQAFCRALAAGLSSSLTRRLGAATSVQPAGWQATRYAGFLASVQEPACCWLLAAAEGVIWLELSPPAAKAISGVLLEGRCDANYQSDRPPTPVERRLLGRFVDAVGETLDHFAGRGGEHRIRAIERGSDEERRHGDDERAVLAASFTIRLLGGQGWMRLCLPQELCRCEESSPAPEASADPPAALIDALPADEAGPVDLAVAAPATTIALEELQALAPGDVLVTDADAEAEVIVYIAGRKRFAARLGSRNGKRAITITRRLDEAE